MIKDNPDVSATELAEATKMSLESVLLILGQLIGLGHVVREGIRNIVTKRGARLAALRNREQLKVMYRYEEAENAPTLKTKSRGFCQMLMNSNKLYTRKEIEGTKNHMKGFNKDVWAFRGGWYNGVDRTTPMCRHVWKQVIVKKNGN